MKTLLTPLRLALLAALVVVAVAGFVLVPAGAMLPVHWGITGAADAFWPKELALLMPVLMAGLVWGVFLVLPRLAPPGELHAGRHPLGVVLTSLTVLALLIEGATVLIGIGVAVNMVQVLALAIGVGMLVLGNAMPKSRPNSLAGLRLPTTLRDPKNWQATHRFTGMLVIGGGVLLLIVALVAPVTALVWWLLACVLLPVAAGVLYSLALARRPPDRRHAGRRH
jgi:uncharacterized membrane protein